MKRRRMNITVSEPAFRTLGQLDNHSDYLTRLVDHHDREWRSALVMIQARGVKNGDLLVVVDKLHGHHPPGLPARVLVRNVIKGVYGPLPGGRKRWGPCLEALEKPEDGPELARMVCIIAAECWLGNSILRRELGIQ